MDVRLPQALAQTGRFEVRQCLGSGAYGVVWAAHDRERDTEIALKWLRHSDAATIARFKREFRSLADLVHPNLITFRDLLTVGDEWFFTMDRLDGVDLLRYMRPSSTVPGPAGSAGAATALEATAALGVAATDEAPAATGAPPVPSSFPATDASRALCAAELPRVRATLEQLAAGLMALHGAGMLHRDIKPSNVLVTREGRVVLLDFGLVTEIGQDGIAETMKGRVVGTPAYMSPEQALGMPLTPESDWYSVGAILYQALTGQLPYDGEPYDVLFRKQLADPPPPVDIVRGVPRTLSDLCLELLSRAPEKRPLGARFLERLRQALPFGGGVEAWTPSAPAIPLAAADAAGSSPALAAAYGSSADRALGAAADEAADARKRVTSGGVPLVGRETHLWALDEALADVGDGKTVIALVHGASGMGKSALVRHFLDVVRRERPGTVVLEGRCYAREAVPYKAVDSLADALCRHLQRLPKVQANALLPRDLPLLAKLFPTFLQLDGAGMRRPRGGGDAVQERRRAFEALRELLQRIADESALVLYIDDLHWGDADSEPLLATLLRAPDPPPMLFIASFRSEDAASSPLVSALERIAIAGDGVELCDVPVGELSPQAARQLAATLLARSADDTRTEELARESCGSPLFLRQLAALGASDRTIGLSEAVRRRVDALGDEARRVLEVLAVSGRPLAVPIAAHAASIARDRDAVLAQLRAESLVRTRLVDARDEVEVYHDRIREVVVAALPPETLAARHKALAHALATAGADDAEALAEHLYAGSEPELAAEYARKAAERAADALAFDRAARMYQMAVELETTLGRDASSLVVRLADALACAGRGKEAADRFLAAATHAQGADALELRRRAAEQLLFSGHLERGLAVVDEILTTMKMSLRRGRVATLAALVFGRLVLRLRGFRFRARRVDELPREQLVRLDTCFGLSRGLGIVDTFRGAVFQTRYIRLALAAGEPVRIAMGLSLEAAYRATDGERARAIVGRLNERALALLARTETGHALGLSLLMRAIAGTLLCDFHEALALADEAQSVLRERCRNVTWELDNAAFFAGYSLMHLGRIRELRGRMPWHLEDMRARGDLYGEVLLRVQLAYFVRLVDDDVEGARTDLAVLRDRWSEKHGVLQYAWRTISDVEVELYAGDAERAYASVEDVWPTLEDGLVLRVVSVRVRCMNARARATLAAALAATGARRAELLARAEAHARAIARERWGLARGYALLLRGGLAAARGEREAATATLRAAIAELAARDIQVYASAARIRLGRLLGGDDGRELVETGEGALRDEGAREPSRFARVFAPGADEGA